MGAADPPLRADARRNRDQILKAARDAFADSGFAAPLDAIAARAGVGPGTVYRHFPTKEALFHAVVTARVADLVADLVAEARRRAADAHPGDAFFAFLARLGAEGAATRDIPDAIALPSPLRNQLHDALEVLLTSAHDGTEPGRAERILAIVTDGLRAPHP